MKRSLFYILILFFAFLFSEQNYGQELPPIQNFKTEVYGADNQNWMISEAENHYMYIANNEGLLEYNGEKWQLYPSPNNTIIRSVKAIGDKIFTGSYMDFGYWSKNEKGYLVYTSLSERVKNTLDDESFWNIVHHHNTVLFQSYKRLYIYDILTNEIKFHNFNGKVTKLFSIYNEVLYYIPKDGLYIYKDGNPKRLTLDPLLTKIDVINVFPYEENKYLIATINHGFFILSNDKLTPWQIPFDSTLKQITVYSCIQLYNNDIVVGTISDGIFYIQKNGQLKFQINQKNGLGNNTALTLFEDTKNNIWIGLDNGIDLILMSSSFTIYNDNNGILGTIYAAIIFKDYLYLGTNQGLFCRKVGQNSSFQFIKGTSGQVWNLFDFNHTDLLCGHHYGTFVVKDNQAIQIDKNFGAWKFENISNQNSDLLMVGNYDGLNVLEKKNGLWTHRNKISGFKLSSRFFEIDDQRYIWVSHEYKGVYRLQVDADYRKITDSFLVPELKLSESSCLVKYNKDILYATKEGIYRKSSRSSIFVKDEALSKLINKEQFLTGKMVVDVKNNIWTFSNDKVSFASYDHVTKKLLIQNIFIPLKDRKVISGFENITYLKGNEFLLGTADGFIIFDVEKINLKKYHAVVSIHSITSTKHKEAPKFLNLNEKEILKNNYGVLNFYFSVPEYDKFQNIQYQYKLEGNNNDWSEWSDRAFVSFENLSFGNYTFWVRAKVGNQISDNTASYKFKVKRPWFISNVMLSFYLLLITVCLYIIYKVNKEHFQKKLKQEQIENEKIIVQIKNEKLVQDIESKNKELALTKMSIIRKNELLNSIKRELRDEEKNNLNVVRLIERNLNNNKDWEFFVETFNNYDKGFLDRLKKLHPDLTHNDLRLSVYLRMNLTSKEISRLMNISVKSVETKRYRLRKRMSLEHTSNLIDYILQI